MVSGFSSPVTGSHSSVTAYMANKPEGKVTRKCYRCRNQSHNEEAGQSNGEDGGYTKVSSYKNSRTDCCGVPSTTSRVVMRMNDNTKATKVIEAMTHSEKPLQKHQVQHKRR
jgi:hypothetical protein